MQAIAAAIQQIQVGWQSQKIRLEQAILTEPECTLLKNALKEHSSVKSLEICVCDIPTAELIAFANGMKDYSLVGLQLIHLQLNDDVASALATAVQECALKKLDLAVNKMTSKGAIALAGALNDCGLESLLLSRNKIGSAGVTSIAQVLSKGQSNLQTLDVSRNQIGDKGFIALCDALPTSNLDTLMVDSNGITHVGIVALCEALKKSPRLLNLSVGGNGLKDESIILLANTLKFTNLERLSINGNDFGPEAMTALSAAVSASMTLQLLDLKQNLTIRDEDLRVLIESIRTHRTLSTVVVDDTGTTQPIRERLQRQLGALQNEHAKTMTVLCSVKNIPRVGTHSTLWILPKELIRRMSIMLMKI